MGVHKKYVKGFRKLLTVSGHWDWSLYNRNYRITDNVWSYKYSIMDKWFTLTIVVCDTDQSVYINIKLWHYILNDVINIRFSEKSCCYCLLLLVFFCPSGDKLAIILNIEKLKFYVSCLFPYFLNLHFFV